jgi:hypothetical protein
MRQDADRIEVLFTKRPVDVPLLPLRSPARRIALGRLRLRQTEKGDWLGPQVTFTSGFARSWNGR